MIIICLLRFSNEIYHIYPFQYELYFVKQCEPLGIKTEDKDWHLKKTGIVLTEKNESTKSVEQTGHSKMENTIIGYWSCNTKLNKKPVQTGHYNLEDRYLKK